METINKLETTVEGWYKGLPHLPKAFTQWLATNVWWLALISVILGAFAVFSLLSVTLFAGAVLTAAGGAYGAALGGFALISVLFYLALAIITLIITVLAIAPLKAHAKKGWSLLFLAAVINAVSLIISFLSNYNLFGMIWGIAMTAVGVYFLFEIRSYFSDARGPRPTLNKAA